MIIYWVALALAVPAGMGVMKLIDRQWPQRVEVSHRPAPAPVPEARRVLEFDDTMDVLGAGVDVGVKIGRHARQQPSLAQLAERWQPPAFNDDSAGWASGATAARDPVRDPVREWIEEAPPAGPSFIYRGDPDVPAETLTAEYADRQQPAGGGV